MKHPLAFLLLLSACGPMALPQAERACVADAQLAQHPRGSVGVGIGSDGRMATEFTLGISSDYLFHRDPDQVFAAIPPRSIGGPAGHGKPT